MAKQKLLASPADQAVIDQLVAMEADVDANAPTILADIIETHNQGHTHAIPDALISLRPMYTRTFTARMRTLAERREKGMGRRIRTKGDGGIITVWLYDPGKLGKQPADQQQQKGATEN